MKRKSDRRKEVSVESVLSVIRERGMSVNVKSVMMSLGVPKTERSKIKKILKQLSREGQIEKSGNKFGAAGAFESSNTAAGKVDLKADFGFLLVEGGEDIFLGRRAVAELLPGDEVEIYVKKTRTGSREGTLKRIIKRGDGPFMCRVKMIGTRLYASLVFKETPFIKLKKNDFDLKVNDIVLIEVEETSAGLSGEVISHLDDTDNVEMHKLFILNKRDIRQKMPDDVMQEASKLEITPDALKGRVDLRKDTIITIDPFDAKDFDDAISLYTENGNFMLGVHIADVTHFLKEGTAMDEEAFARSVSTYLPGEVIPMLPEKLSNDMCSLVEGKDRLTFSVFMEIDPEGEVIKYDIKESVIRNSKRFAYEQVEDIIKGRLEIKDRRIKEMVLLMAKLKDVLRAKMLKGGMVDFDLGEPVLVMGDGFKVRDIKRKLGLDSHKLIEYCMIYANVCAADYITAHYPAGMFRIHPRPVEKDITEFNDFAAAMGYTVRIKKPESKEFQAAAEKIKGTEKSIFLERKLLRAMQLAKYSEQNLGHFGLALKKYTHFTSPIRRYADVVVHRLIKNALGTEYMKDTDKAYLKGTAYDISEHEENSEKAENDVFRLYALNFLKEKLGDTLEVIITRITKNGFVVELTQYPVEGFMNFDAMRDDYYIYDESRQMAVGRRTKKIFRLGDKISAIIVKITLETLKMELEIDDEDGI
ncbi:MAG TPA: VacB/RNase II family 3'-5' exoribonuclease [Candidatus Goldiibacteriota bacterium]|nr:VacB/RNase II family 3'-5' exoribonuclease [Candidatus Goldiibacteriota bacterium]HRQ43799.1 VacB/RNase II family 3'-5' exoribonuclease [Candidatus Goldiibacteriota bacterium]